MNRVLIGAFLFASVIPTIGRADGLHLAHIEAITQISSTETDRTFAVDYVRSCPQKSPRAFVTYRPDGLTPELMRPVIGVMLEDTLSGCFGIFHETATIRVSSGARVVFPPFPLQPN